MATHLQDRYTGCLLGLALGDACGAPLEGGWPERLLWRCIGTTRQGEMRWTDDTQMALDIGEVLLAQGHDDGALPVHDIAQRFARSYRWSRGYGPGAAKVLRRIRRGVPWQQASRSVYPAGSWGNGGAMRSPVLALWWPGNAEQLVQSTTAITQITHGHALAVEGAVLIAVAIGEVLLAQGHEDDALPVDAIAQRFARSYRWSRGYGPGAAKVLRRIRRGVPWQQASRSVYPAGSWGNGGAMRSPVLALWWPGNAEALVQSATVITPITHGHVLAIEGAVLMAVATAAAVRGEGALAILLAAMHYAYSASGGHYDERLCVASA